MEIWRPWKSQILPLLLPDGWRNTLTCPSSSSQRNWRLFGMSLKIRKFPTAFQAGPSAHRMGLPLTSPCHKRWMVVLPWMSPPNAGSIVSTSGSWKYTDGAVKSRGGLVVDVGGVAGPAPPGGGGAGCSFGAANTPVGANAAAPTTAAAA